MKMKLTVKKQCMAYVLNKDPDFGYSQKKIGQMMGVGQSTISNAIERVERMRTVQDLTQQLEEARNQLAVYGILPEQETPIRHLKD